MPESERECFEVILGFHPGLRAEVAGLAETVNAMVMAAVTPVAPPSDLRTRLLEGLNKLPPVEPEAWVATDPAGLIEWVNPAFTALCGYALEELKGRKPGQVLQGPATDPGAVERIRHAVRNRSACRETLVNYHKDGSQYRVEVRIDSILDDLGQPMWFVARERKIPIDAHA